MEGPTREPVTMGGGVLSRIMYVSVDCHGERPEAPTADCLSPLKMSCPELHVVYAGPSLTSHSSPAFWVRVFFFWLKIVRILFLAACA